jgi:hypothetical protein
MEVFLCLVFFCSFWALRASKVSLGFRLDSGQIQLTGLLL